MYRLLVGLALGWLLAGIRLGAMDLAPVPARDPAELEQRITGILREHRVPGACAVLAGREGVQWMTGIGQSDVAAGRAATSDTLFRIGSISKMFAALAALKLVEEGRLDLEAPVRSLVPEVAFRNPWEATHPVRVVHLLEHTAGWDDLSLKEYAHNDPRPVSLAEALAVAPETRTSRWRPGTRYAYCNSGPAVTAAIVEKLTGRRFEDYVRDEIFRPIGMPSADYFHPGAAEERLTRLYREDGRTPYPYQHILMRPAGSVNASAREMGACLRFFLRRGEGAGGRLLADASIQRMETPATFWGAQGGLKTGYGLHNFTMQDARGFLWHGHDGGVEGGLAELAYLPEQGIGYSCAINAGHGGAFRKIVQELRAYATRDLAGPALPPAQAVPAGIVAEYSGWYRPISPRMERLNFLERLLGLGRLEFRGERLLLKSPFGPSQEMVFLEGRSFRSPRGRVATAVLMDSGEGRLLQFHDLTLRRVNTGVAWIEILGAYLVAAAMVSVLLFAPIWGLRWVFRRMKGVSWLHMRILPLLAVLAFGTALGIVLGGADEAILNFGRRTAWSVALAASTWAFAGLSLASLGAVLRSRGRGMNPWAFGHSLAVSALLVLAMVYLARWGIIGLRTWT